MMLKKRLPFRHFGRLYRYQNSIVLACFFLTSHFFSFISYLLSSNWFELVVSLVMECRYIRERMSNSVRCWSCLMEVFELCFY